MKTWILWYFMPASWWKECWAREGSQGESQMFAAGRFWYLLQWLSNIDPWTSSDVIWDHIRNAFASYTQHMQQELCEWGPAICLHKPPRRFRCTLGCVNHSFRVLNQGPLSPQGSFAKIWRHWLSLPGRERFYWHLVRRLGALLTML